jgi:hypothetical protein
LPQNGHKALKKPDEPNNELTMRTIMTTENQNTLLPKKTTTSQAENSNRMSSLLEERKGECG